MRNTYTTNVHTILLMILIVIVQYDIDDRIGDVKKSVNNLQLSINSIETFSPIVCTPFPLPKNTRGFANNNPGNLKGRGWKGQVGIDKQGFAVFSRPEWGLRMMARVLKNYHQNSKLNTVNAILEKYAKDEQMTPKQLANLQAYKQYVAIKLDIGVNEQFNVPMKMAALMKAMISWENGSNPYPDYMLAIAEFMGEE